MLKLVMQTDPLLVERVNGRFTISLYDPKTHFTVESILSDEAADSLRDDMNQTIDTAKATS